jgi:hypothetical protein
VIFDGQESFSITDPLRNPLNPTWKSN